MNNGKRWWQSRTVILNIIIAVIAIVGVLMNMPEFAHLTPWLLLTTNVLNILVRVFLTSQPIEGGPK